MKMEYVMRAAKSRSIQPDGIEDYTEKKGLNLGQSCP